MLLAQWGGKEERGEVEKWTRKKNKNGGRRKRFNLKDVSPTHAGAPTRLSSFVWLPNWTLKLKSNYMGRDGSDAASQTNELLPLKYVLISYSWRLQNKISSHFQMIDARELARYVKLPSTCCRPHLLAIFTSKVVRNLTGSHSSSFVNGESTKRTETRKGNVCKESTRPILNRSLKS